MKKKYLYKEFSIENGRRYLIFESEFRLQNGNVHTLCIMHIEVRLRQYLKVLPGEEKFGFLVNSLAGTATNLVMCAIQKRTSLL